MGYRKKLPPSPDPTRKGKSTPKREVAREARKLTQDQVDEVFAGLANGREEKKQPMVINRSTKRGMGIRKSNKAGYRRRNNVGELKQYTVRKTG